MAHTSAAGTPWAVAVLGWEGLDQIDRKSQQALYLLWILDKKKAKEIWDYVHQRNQRGGFRNLSGWVLKSTKREVEKHNLALGFHHDTDYSKRRGGGETGSRECWVPLQSGRWRGWLLRVAIIGHPEQSQVDHHEMWPSMTTVYHEMLVHLSTKGTGKGKGNGKKGPYNPRDSGWVQSTQRSTLALHDLVCDVFDSTHFLCFMCLLCSLSVVDSPPIQWLLHF
ncbi:unnamed protein product [Durusdinium trenchii]|uniref:Uncharacterized protein n=1 Tax=Durusdinium trenchii TaxID=1381693 RepID=A0ABP0KAC4_9DINO